ncbi:MAG: LacI family DNA-binding transcriptional regulator [Candidatus Weimeria sp.]
MKKITINDVAREAGVSVSTVSKVMNGWSTISEATVCRVKSAAESLHYTPNAKAVNFARGTTHNIIYLTELKKGTAYSNPHMFDTMCGAFYSLAKNGYTMSLMDISDEDHPKETIKQIMDQKSADGIIIHGSVISQDIANLILDRNFPHIVIGHPIFDNRLCWIDTNHTLAGEHAAEFILQHNLTPSVFICGKKTDNISHERETGFRNFLLHHGHPLSKDDILYTDSSWQEGYNTTETIIKRGNIPVSIVCENNALALGTARALNKYNISVPDQITFITFDEFPYASVLYPKPIVVTIDVYDLGLQVGELIIKKIKNPSLMIQSYTTLPKIL